MRTGIRGWGRVGGGLLATLVAASVLLAGPALASTVEQQGAQFTVLMTCPATGPQLSGFPKTFTLTPGGSQLITGIPEGVQCSITETRQGGASSVTYTVNGGSPSQAAPTVTINPTAEQHVVLTNNFPAPPKVVPVPPAIPDLSKVITRAFVAGEAVHFADKAPNGCDPILHVDGRSAGAVPTRNDGTFDVAAVTRDLAAGEHVAEVYCTHPVGRLLHTSFWVAAPQSSSNVFFVVLVSLLVVFAIGWVSLRTLAGSGSAPPTAGARGRDRG
jgi:hypothetical protein